MATQPSSREKLLELVGGSQTPSPDEFKQLCTAIESHQVLAKVFLLEGVPFVFEKSPMKYVIFREQVAERFGVGSQDVCIVGSAKLGYSPSPYQFGTPFSEQSDVDVVIISEPLFYRGSRELFVVLNTFGPPLHEIRGVAKEGKSGRTLPVVNLDDWKKVKEAIRNFVYENFNPGLLPQDHALRREIFSKISSTAGLFLALEPKVFVSKIRCRIFRNWKAAEDYYANSLREARNYFVGKGTVEPELHDSEELEEEA
jgi:hypothetical protein